MTSKEIVQLKKAEYSHLLSIPYRVAQEQSLFCQNIIDILDQKIIDDPETCAYLIREIKQEHLQTEIQQELESRWNEVKLSIYEYIKNSGSEKFRSLFFSNIRGISMLPENREMVLSRYLKALVRTGVRNLDHPILLNSKTYSVLLSMTKPAKFHELYACLFQINVQTKDLRAIERLKKTLWSGSPLEKFVMRTGWLEPKWHETLYTDFKQAHKEQMVAFLSIADLKVLTETFVREKDIVNSNIYFNLLVQKLEFKTNQLTAGGHLRDGDTGLNDDMSTIIQVALKYFMTFKSPTSCLKILKYMNRNNLKVDFKVLLVIIQHLDRQNHFQEALITINSIPLDGLSRKELLELAHEILVLVKKQYPTMPEVMAGYIAAIMGLGALELLNDLKLLGFTHGSGSMGSISSLDQIKKANLDPRLTGFELDANALANYYEIVFHSVQDTLSVETVLDLFSHYKKAMKERSLSVNDRVVYHMVNFLLRKSPGSNDFKLHESRERMNAAKKVYTEFTKEFELSRQQLSASTIDLLVYASLMIHKDFTFAAEIIKYSRSKHVPFTFNQIYPFIKYHYSREEYDRAHVWYNELIKHAVVATAAPAKDLFKMARDQKWEVSGFVFKKMRIHNNRKSRKEIANVRMDSLSFLQDLEKENDVDDDDRSLVTNEVMKTLDAEPDFVSELSTILYENGQRTRRG